MKSWFKPELIILVRSRSEEAVLIACKTGGSAPGGITVSGCIDNQSKKPFRCVVFSCDTLAPS
jgi:hypothetical protein